MITLHRERQTWRKSFPGPGLLSARNLVARSSTFLASTLGATATGSTTFVTSIGPSSASSSISSEISSGFSLAPPVHAQFSPLGSSLTISPDGTGASSSSSSSTSMISSGFSTTGAGGGAATSCRAPPRRLTTVGAPECLKSAANLTWRWAENQKDGCRLSRRAWSGGEPRVLLPICKNEVRTGEARAGGSAHLVAEEGLLSNERLRVAVLLNSKRPVVRHEDVRGRSSTLELMVRGQSRLRAPECEDGPEVVARRRTRGCGIQT